MSEHDEAAGRTGGTTGNGPAGSGTPEGGFAADRPRPVELEAPGAGDPSPGDGSTAAGSGEAGGDEVRRRAVGLFRFVRDFAQLRTRPVRDVAAWDHLWLADLPASGPGDERIDCFVRDLAADGPAAPDATPGDDTEPAASTAAGDAGDDLWIEISRRPEPPAPAVPEACRAHLIDTPPADDGTPRPPRRRPPDGDGPASDDDASPDPPARSPAIDRAFEAWLASAWGPWAERHERWRRHEQAYVRLFAMHQALQRRGEEVELVVGTGLLEWPAAPGGAVRRHLLAMPVAIEFDAATATLQVRPTPEGDGCIPELEMVEPSQRPERWEERVRDAADALRDRPWDAGLLAQLFTAAANGMAGGRGRFEPTVDAPCTRTEGASAPGHAGEGSAADPLVRLAPALVLRRRSRSAMVGRLQEVIDDLDRGGTITANLHRAAGGARPDDGGAEAPADAPLLPLPANDAQLEIVRRLETRDGLLVQGPPGTGKSHTIANLICHLLASGRRVLVTAQTPRALRVLRRKLPESIRPLCLSLLESDRQATDELAASVATIVERIEAGAEDERRRPKVEARLEAARAERAAIEEAIRERRRAEAEPIAIDAVYRGTPQRIAARIAEDADAFAWFTDAVDPSGRPAVGAGATNGAAADEAPATLAASNAPAEGPPAGLADDLHAHGLDAAAIPAERAEALRSWAFPPEELVPPLDEVRDLVRRAALAETDSSRLDEPLATLRLAEGHEVEQLRDALLDLESAAGRLAAATGERRPWLEGAVRDVMAGDAEPWRERADVVRSAFATIEAQVEAADARTVRRPDDLDPARLRADAADLRAHLEAGRGTGWLARLLHPVVRRTQRLRTEVEVDGRPCDTAERLALLEEVLETEAALGRAWAYLVDLAPRPTGPLRLQAAALREVIEDLEAVSRLAAERDRAAQAVARIEGLPDPSWPDAAERLALRRSCETDLERRDAGSAVRAVAALADRLAEARPGAPPHVAELEAALRAGDLDAWTRAAAEDRALRDERQVLRRREQRGQRLAEIVPDLVRALEAQPHDPDWPARFDRLDAAWARAVAIARVRAFAQATDRAGLESRRLELDDEIAALVAELAGLRAWAHARASMSDEHRRHLAAWVLANRNLGRGTGRYAARRRRLVRELLQACREAIPAWVMPLYRVFEQVEPRPGAFDVVIVDEASQCSLDAMALLHLGRKLVVVGDDEQISPTMIVEREQLFELSRRHLPGDRIAAVFEPDTSLFDLARVWFADPVVLREHFRCVPEIISFSDRLCYGGRLIPLTQYAADRLEPIRPVLVPEARRRGRGSDTTNPAEATAMVDAIAAAHEDPAYAGRTFGMVSLLGERQAELVERLLVRRIGPEAMQERRLVCGDAYGFQGDERDVMFMGLVAAATFEDGEAARLTALVRRDAKQRFNVAASRAREQMWLFHSVTLDDLRNPADLRRRLLEHCLAPPRDQAPGRDDLAPETIEEALAESDRGRSVPPVPFRSWLQAETWLRLVRRGYDAVPGFRVAGHELDLVVRHEDRMLAIDCEGDEWEGDEAFAAARAARDQLQRAGWTFARVRGTSLHLDPGRAMSDLWRRLDRLSIRVRRSAAAPSTESAAGDRERSVADADSGGDPAAPTSPVSSGASPPPAGDGGASTEPADAAAAPAASPDARDTRAQAAAIDDALRDAADERTEASRAPAGADDGAALPTFAEVDLDADRLPAAVVPYRGWSARTVPPPREAAPAEMAGPIEEIVLAEGPMLASTLVVRYRDAAGLSRLPAAWRARIEAAIDAAVADGAVRRLEDEVRPGTTVDVLAPAHDDGRVRRLGDRRPDEVPPIELRRFAAAVLAEDPVASDAAILRRAGAWLGLERLRGTTREALEHAIARTRSAGADA